MAEIGPDDLSPTDRQLIELIEGDYVDGMVTGWTLIGTFIDAETGDPKYFSHTMLNQSASATLGQLEHAACIERAHIVRRHFEDD